MKIAFVSSEMTPFAKTGGLAEVAGTLSAEFRKLRHDVIRFLPFYKGIQLGSSSAAVFIDSLKVDLGSEEEVGRVLKSTAPDGGDIYFIDHKGFFQRDHLYGPALSDYPDNDRRFIFFQRAVLETLRTLKWKPDVIHCHDWQAGLIPTYIKTIYAKDSLFAKTKTIFTIHNLAYQGNFPPDSMPLTGLDWGHFTMDRLEFYGKVSFMKAGILDSDLVTTVSERYSREIQTLEFGCNLEGVLQEHHDKLIGIVNGIDVQEWEPNSSATLSAPFSALHPEGKQKCKEALQRADGLDVNPQVPVISMITRLVEQKGIDIVVESLGRMVAMGFQFVLLGTGEEKYHKVFREIGKKFRGQCSVHILFDAGMAKRIYAGSDMLLVPSYYEPCGISQMIALRYGTVPVVRATGGLADTISSFDPKSLKGNGFVFEEYQTAALLETLDQALAVYKNPKLWSKLVQNALACDFSWTRSAAKYLEVFESCAKRPGPGSRKG